MTPSPFSAVNTEQYIKLLTSKVTVKFSNYTVPQLCQGDIDLWHEMALQVSCHDGPVHYTYITWRSM